MSFLKGFKSKAWLLCTIILLGSPILYAQQDCQVTAISSADGVVCGDEVILSAEGIEGLPFYLNDFNDGTFGDAWTATDNALTSNDICGPGPDDTTYFWSSQGGIPRHLTTAQMNLPCGGQICFDMKMATQGVTAPCEGPDQPNEGIYLQFSTDNGVTWNDIEYFDPYGQTYAGDPYTQWDQYCFAIPGAAVSSQTQFRWFQTNYSGYNYDHWGLDNIEVTLNCPLDDWWMEWSTGETGESITVSPNTPTDYTVTLTNGVLSCQDTVHVDAHPVPEADFNYQQEYNESYDNNSIVHTDNTSLGDNLSFNWYIDGIWQSTEESPEFNLPGSGSYECTLIADNGYCESSTMQEIIVNEKLRIYIPNAFTPNGDGHNDEWFPVIKGAASYEVVVLDRWGQEVFRGGLGSKWDGRFKGAPLPNGVYTYQLYPVEDATTGQDSFKPQVGSITLVR